MISFDSRVHNISFLTKWPFTQNPLSDDWAGTLHVVYFASPLTSKWIIPFDSGHRRAFLKREDPDRTAMQSSIISRYNFNIHKSLRDPSLESLSKTKENRHLQWCQQTDKNNRSISIHSLERTNQERVVARYGACLAGGVCGVDTDSAASDFRCSRQILGTSKTKQ